MKPLKALVGLASVAALVLALTSLAHAATITLGPNLDSPKTLAISMQEPSRSCAIPHTDAAIAGTPFFEMPTIAKEKGDSGSSIVLINLASSGTLQHYDLVESSGSSVLDDSALRTARLTKYQPETLNCAAIGGSYLLEVDF